jgi:hypothetical protein
MKEKQEDRIRDFCEIWASSNKDIKNYENIRSWR